jgi:hypothetical protein
MLKQKQSDWSVRRVICVWHGSQVNLAFIVLKGGPQYCALIVYLSLAISQEVLVNFPWLGDKISHVVRTTIGRTIVQCQSDGI